MRIEFLLEREQAPLSVDLNFSSEIMSSQSPPMKDPTPIYVELGSLADDDYDSIQKCIDKKWIVLSPVEGKRQRCVRICRATNRRCSLTLGYLKALSMGFCIVDVHWLHDSVRELVLLPIEEYELEGALEDGTEGAPFRARSIARRQDGRSTLFDGFEFCYVRYSADDATSVRIVDLNAESIRDTMTPFCAKECECLMHISGGIILSRTELRLEYMF